MIFLTLLGGKTQAIKQSSNQAIKQSSNQAIKQSKSSVKTFTRLSSAVVMGMALLAASGQAFAFIYGTLSNIASSADFTDGTKWSTSNCGLAAVGGIITPTPADFFGICPGFSLTLAATDVVSFGILAFGASGTWVSSGVLKFSTGNKAITNYNSSLASIALNVTSMTTGDTISISGGGSFFPVTFSSVTGGSLSCGGAAYTAGNAIAAGITCTVTVTPPAVSAPIGFDFNKPAKVFTTEVKVK